MSIRETNNIKKAKQKADFGKLAEDEAVKYLRAKGYQIITRNWHCREGEIDIIAKYNQAVSFVEVRAKLSDEMGHPLETINRTKQKKIILAATRYIQNNYLEDTEISFDVIGMTKNEDGFSIIHVPNAFEDW